MDKDDHIKLVELINFAKGIYGKEGDKIDEKRQYERIVLHLGSCTSCMKGLRDIEYVKSNFDKVWENIYQSGAESSTSQVPRIRILEWIKEIRNTFKEGSQLIFRDIENMLQEGAQNITERVIPVTITTHGKQKPGEQISDKLSFYFSNPEDSSLFDTIEFKDETLVFNSTSDPGYSNILIIGPDGFYRKIPIRAVEAEFFSAKKSNLELESDSYLIHLYK